MYVSLRINLEVSNCNANEKNLTGFLLKYIVPIQGVPGGKVNILGGHSTGHSKQKYLYEHVSYPNGFQDIAI